MIGSVRCARRYYLELGLVHDALYIDAAYRYVDLGYTEASGALNGDQIKVGSRPYNHEFMLGLRFAF